MPVYELDGYRYEIDTEQSKYRVVSKGDPIEFVDWLTYFGFIAQTEGFRLIKQNGVIINVRATEV